MLIRSHGTWCQVVILSMCASDDKWKLSFNSVIASTDWWRLSSFYEHSATSHKEPLHHGAVYKLRHPLNAKHSSQQNWLQSEINLYRRNVSLLACWQRWVNNLNLDRRLFWGWLSTSVREQLLSSSDDKIHTQECAHTCVVWCFYHTSV